jgi:hypothetical protein
LSVGEASCVAGRRAVVRGRGGGGRGGGVGRTTARFVTKRRNTRKFTYL